MERLLISHHYQEARVKIRNVVSQLQHKDLDGADVEEWVKHLCADFLLKPILVGDGNPEIIERFGGTSVGIFLPIESLNDAVRVLQFTPGTWKNANDVWGPTSGGIVLEANSKSPDRILASIEAIKENI